jgi:hypothetical protein
MVAEIPCNPPSFFLQLLPQTHIIASFAVMCRKARCSMWQ